MTSGVHQGCVLGPILFLVYTNGMPDEPPSPVRLYAVGTAVYLIHIIEGSDDGNVLQNDLGSLFVWEDSRDMEFNPYKCQWIQLKTSKTLIHSVHSTPKRKRNATVGKTHLIRK